MIKLYPSNLTAFQNKLKNLHINAKIFNIQHSKIHTVWHPNKSTRHAKRQENTIQDEEKNQLVKTDPGRIQIIDFINNNISKMLL